MDYADCGDYFYCDTRGERASLGPGLPFGSCRGEKPKLGRSTSTPSNAKGTLKSGQENLWPDRRMPRLRILSFQEDEDQPQVIAANVSAESVSLEPREGICKFRITLPEWMVEPGK